MIVCMYYFISYIVSNGENKDVQSYNHDKIKYVWYVCKSHEPTNTW